MTVSFSATVSPTGLTFIGNDGRTFVIGRDSILFKESKDRVQTIKALSPTDPAYQHQWATLTNSARDKKIPSPKVSVPVETKSSTTQIHPRKFLIAIRELESNARTRTSSDSTDAAMKRLLEHTLNSSLETAHNDGTLNGSQLATLRAAYERVYHWDTGSDLEQAPRDNAPLPTRAEKSKPLTVPTIKLREDFQNHKVRVLVNEREVHRNSEYYGAIEWVKAHYPNADLLALYHDYKVDYDNGGEEYNEDSSDDDFEAEVVQKPMTHRYAIIMKDGDELIGHGCFTLRDMEEYLKAIPVGVIKIVPYTEEDRLNGRFVPV